jgi:hypothetical protein
MAEFFATSLRRLRWVRRPNRVKLLAAFFAIDVVAVIAIVWFVTR